VHKCSRQKDERLIGLGHHPDPFFAEPSNKQQQTFPDGAKNSRPAGRAKKEKRGKEKKEESFKTAVQCTETLSFQNMSASASASASAADGGTDNDNLAIDSRHHSKSHKRGIHAGIAAYDKYAAGHKPALPPLAQTPAAIFCDKRNMQKFAHYLVYTALAKGSKEPLSESTVDNYLSAVMNATKERFSETHGEFFLVLGGRNSSITTPNNWLQQLSFNVGNLIRKRDIERGCELEEDTPGLSRTALVEIVGAYFACNTPDAMYRRFVLHLPLPSRVNFVFTLPASATTCVYKVY